MNTSSGYHATIGKKKKHKGGNTQKLPSELKARMEKPRQAQQEVPDMWLSAYGTRRKMKMKGM